MKPLALALLLLLPVSLLAATPNAADYPVTVHIVASHAMPLGFFAGGWQITYQQVDAVIDGQSMQLIAPSQGLLALGDYHARISPVVHGPHNPNSYDLYKGYDLLMPDGKVRTFQVSGLGTPAVTATSPSTHP